MSLSNDFKSMNDNFINHLKSTKDSLIDERNDILNNWFKRIFYFMYRKRLIEIDIFINSIDSGIYNLEKNKSLNGSNKNELD